VFSSKNFSKTHIGFLASSLAFVDTVGLIWNFVVYKCLPLMGYGLDIVVPFTCFTFQWISRVLQQIPLYVQLLITLVNYLKVISPFKHKYLNKKSTILQIIFTMIICDGFINSTNMFRYLSFKKMLLNSSSSNQSTMQTIVSCGSSNTMGIVSNFITSLLRSFIPSIMMVVLNYLTFVHLINSKKKFASNLKKEKAFAKVLFILDIIFFIFNVPLSCTEILTAVFKNILLLPANNKAMALANLLHGFANTWAYFFYVMPFFINLIFNQAFKRELFLILKHRNREYISNSKSVFANSVIKY
jgi:hypothetical protein